MQRIISITALWLTAVLASSAHAALDLTEFGTFTTTAYGDCFAPCNNTDVDFVTFELVGPQSGGEGILSTTQTLTGASINHSGDLFAEATILGGLSTPLLRASATSNAGKVGLIDAVGIQGYSVNGGGNGQMISADINLTGTIANPNGNDLTGLSAAVSLVKVVNPQDFEFQTYSLFLIAPDVSLSQSTSGAVNLMGTANLLVDEGDQFYLVALLGASAGGAGAEALSLSTLTVNFDAASAAVLVPAGVVPLPGALVLMLPALLAFGVRRAG